MFIFLWSYGTLYSLLVYLGCLSQPLFTRPCRYHSKNAAKRMRLHKLDLAIYAATTLSILPLIFENPT